MPNPRDLLICLLDYIKEQPKQVNPAAYRLANAKGFGAAVGFADHAQQAGLGEDLAGELVHARGGGEEGYGEPDASPPAGL